MNDTLPPAQIADDSLLDLFTQAKSRFYDLSRTRETRNANHLSPDLSLNESIREAGDRQRALRKELMTRMGNAL